MAGGLPAGATCDVAPVRLQRLHGCAGHPAAILAGVVFGKVEIGRAGHHPGVHDDGRKGRFVISAKYGVVADIALLPGVQNGEQIIGVLAQMILFPEIQQLFNRVEPLVAPELVSEERLGIGPAGVYPAEGS